MPVDAAAETACAWSARDESARLLNGRESDGEDCDVVADRACPKRSRGE